jgi:hypothetical protein
MNGNLSKQDLDFLDFSRKTREAKKAVKPPLLKDEQPKIGGDMSIPEPMQVNSNGDMDIAVYKKCSTIMTVCVNMVQKMLTDAGNEAGVSPAQALKNIDAWVAAFADFPLPVFNFSETQSQAYKKDDFALSVNPEVVESIVNIKNVAALKDAVVKALQDSGSQGKGNLVSYSNQQRDFNYFGIITGYKATSIDVRIVSFQMHMKNTDVKTLCGGVQKTSLDSNYDTYMFSADSEMMQKLSDKMGDKLIDYFADQLYTFIQQFYDDQLKNFKNTLKNIFQKK